MGRLISFGSSPTRLYSKGVYTISGLTLLINFPSTSILTNDFQRAQAYQAQHYISFHGNEISNPIVERFIREARQSKAGEFPRRSIL